MCGSNSRTFTYADFDLIICDPLRRLKARFSKRRALLKMGALFFVLGTAGVIAGTYTFTCSVSECGSYLGHSITVTTVGDAYNDLTAAQKSAMQLMPWWNDGTLAKAWAQTANLRGSTSNAPLFTYSVDSSNTSGYNVDNSGTTALLVSNRNADREYIVGFQDNGVVPEIDGGKLPSAILLLISLFLMFRYPVVSKDQW